MSDGMAALRHPDLVDDLAAIGFDDPRALMRLLTQVGATGANVAAGALVWSELDGSRVAVHDDVGQTTYAELAARIRAIAAGFSRRGFGPGTSLGLLCRNHAGFVEALGGSTLAGCTVVLLNTGFAGPQLASVARRECLDALIHDAEFAPLIGYGLEERPRFVVGRAPGDATELEELARESVGDWLPPEVRGRSVVRTSGTTGTPKGAYRSESDAQVTEGGANPMNALRRLGLRSRDRVLLAAPLFHSWGGQILLTTLLFGGTALLQRGFEADRTLATIDQRGADALVTVPVMLRRILALEPARRKAYRLESLRTVAASGSPLPGSLALAWMDAFGDRLHNLYGSTEVGVVAIAGPEHLRAAPGTVGVAPSGVSIRILDTAGRPVPAGQPGRIFARTPLLFDRYSDGGRKQVIDGHMCTGDVGHIDAGGRLFVDGREDEMIQSGGENVYPLEIEMLLEAHPEIREVAVIGVPDDEFGQRLRAYVVRAPEATLLESDVCAYVRAHLARHKVPREVVFLDCLPRNAAGKVAKRLLDAR